MNILTIENLAKSYGEKVLFHDVTFGIDAGDKIGLIGVNGTGKSTFLKVIAGVDTPDEGQVVKGGSITVEYLPQEPEFSPQESVLAQVFYGRAPVMRVLREYEQTLADSQKNPDDASLQKKLIQLSQEMDSLGGWQLESEAKTVLTKLGIDDFTAKAGTLSGGQRKRIALARALITPSDLLILDEPTNHIDNETVDWLEEYLANRKGALLMVTHDRYFLDRVTNRIIELDRGTLYTYSGNYSQFLEQKVEREERQEASERKRQNLLRNELAWMRRGAQARSTKQKARIQRFEELSAQKAETTDAKLELSAGSSRLGRKIIELENISQTFDDKVLIRDFSYIVLKNDRVGIVGPNGSGKSTLLHIITGQLTPDAGTVDIGQTVKIGCFSQESNELDQDKTVLEYIKEAGHFLPTAEGGMISAAQMLERFLFPPNVQWTPIAKLSGGEKRRLQLLRVLMEAPNVLLLDEPTNDLDVQTLTVLEEYLDDFPGAVILVSHDRYFLDRLVDKIFAFEGDGRITQYVGGYTDYRAASQLRNAAAQAKKPEEKRPAQAQPQKKARSRKFTFAEQREFEQIDGIIAGVEAELRAISVQIDGSGSNFELLQQLTSRKQELDVRLDELLGRWTYLNELSEELQAGEKR